jgi:hypothetical protein
MSQIRVLRDDMYWSVDRCSDNMNAGGDVERYADRDCRN